MNKKQFDQKIKLAIILLIWALTVILTSCQKEVINITSQKAMMSRPTIPPQDINAQQIDTIRFVVELIKINIPLTYPNVLLNTQLSIVEQPPGDTTYLYQSIKNDIVPTPLSVGIIKDITFKINFGQNFKNKTLMTAFSLSCTDNAGNEANCAQTVNYKLYKNGILLVNQTLTDYALTFYNFGK